MGVIDRDTNRAKPRRKHAKYLDTRSGRIRLAMIADNSAPSIEAFVKANVKLGTKLLTDGHASYPGLTGYRHDPRVVGKMAGHVADSDEFARSFRFHLARDSEMKSPTVPISNRPGDARLPARGCSDIDDVVWSSFLGLL